MWNCHACMRRCLNGLIADKIPALRTIPRRPASRAFRTLTPLLQHDAAAENRKVPKLLKREEAKRSRIQKERINNRSSGDSRLKRKPDSPEDRELLRRERTVDALRDPLAFGNHVRLQLSKGKFEDAEELVQVASKSMQCTVSWNHLIDYQMAKGKANAALKTYNKMKKRAQTPDGHTYTILLRGLADNVHYPNSLTNALSIYHSLWAPNSPVKAPNIIHTNAALKVCARADDMDSMWGIAARLPNTGMGSANNLTYTLLLNATRKAAFQSVAEGTSEEATSRREKAILEGRRMWGDIVGRWRKGQVRIDEELVCAMGRLLLIGQRPRDWDDVLSLVEQTMNIPRLTPRLGHVARASEHIPVLPKPATSHDSTPMPESDSASASGSELLPAETAEQEQEEEEDLSKPGGEFDALPSPTTRPTQTSVLDHAKPGANTLSLLLEACTKMRAMATGKAYWTLLTDPDAWAVPPDLDNYSTYLRLLRLTRASAAATSLLHTEILPKGLATTPKVFRLVMSTCVRDKRSPHVVKAANSVLDAMQESLADADFVTLGMYLNLISTSDDLVVVLAGVERLWPHLSNLRGIVDFGGERSVGEEHREGVLEVCQRMVGLCDRLLMQKGGVRGLGSMPAEIKFVLQRWVGRHKRGKGGERGQRRGGAGGGGKSVEFDEDGMSGDGDAEAVAAGEGSAARAAA